jgi:hypothetical protein
MSTGASALLPAALTLLAFAGGVVVGWLWWGRRFVSARLTRNEALSLVEGRLEAELRAKDEEIVRLRRSLREGRR